MIKRKIKAITICLSAFVLIAILYFAVLTPSLKEEDEQVSEPIELVGNEVLATNDRVYVFPPVTRAEMDEIKVTNDEGTFTFYKKKSTFYLKGMESAPYDLELFSQLVVSTGTPLALKRYVLNEGDDLSVYGLSREDNPVCYTITTEDGTIHKMWVGDQIPTGGGYYCQYDERNVVYVLSSSLGLTVFSDVHELITPTLGLPVEQTYYGNVKKLGIIKDNTPLFEITTFFPNENGTADTDNAKNTYEFAFDELKGYDPDVTIYTQVIQACSGLAGTKVLAVGEEISDSILKRDYGIDVNDPFFVVYYDYMNYTSGKENKESCYIFLSQPDEDGNAKAYTTYYKMVVEINVSSLFFYNYDISSYIEPRIAYYSIENVTKIEVWGIFHDNGSKVEISKDFGLKFENSTQSVWDFGTSNYYDKEKIDNFRSVYINIPRIQVLGVTDETDISKMTHIATLAITDKEGERKEYKFYSYSATRCFVTVNDELGTGETGFFYVSRDGVERLLSDTYKFSLGYTVNPGL